MQYHLTWNQIYVILSYHSSLPSHWYMSENWVIVIVQSNIQLNSTKTQIF